MAVLASIAKMHGCIPFGSGMFAPTFSHNKPPFVVRSTFEKDVAAQTILSFAAESENIVNEIPEFCSDHCEKSGKE
jgi:hypothetical protein